MRQKISGLGMYIAWCLIRLEMSTVNRADILCLQIILPSTSNLKRNVPASDRWPKRNVIGLTLCHYSSTDPLTSRPRLSSSPSPPPLPS